MHILKLKNISYKYPNGDVGLKEVNLSIPKGKKIALLGANGAGKTTLMMLLNAIHRPTNGQLLFNNTPYSYNRKGLRDIRKKIGVLFHNPDHQLFAPSVFEEISFGLCQISKDKAWIQQEVKKCLTEFELESIAKKTPHQLSTGQKKRVSMASVLVMKPEVLVCDEPAASLDPYHSNLMFAEFDKLNEAGTTILISTHDVDKALEWADELIVMNEGNILATGKPYDILNNSDLMQQAKLKQPKIIELCQALNIDVNDNKIINIDSIKEIIKKKSCEFL